MIGVLGGVTAVGPIPELAFVVQFTGLGALVEATVALYRDGKHGPDSDRRSCVVTVWTLVGSMIGVVALAVGLE